MKNAQDRRRYLFNAHVDQLFKQRGVDPPYNSTDAVRWLSWLAQKIAEMLYMICMTRVASIAAVRSEIHAHNLPLLPLYRLPNHRLPPHFEVFLALPRQPHRSKNLFGISASIQNDISGHRPHAHLLLVPCSYCISPSGCPLSSLQQAVGYSAGSFIKSN